MARPGGLRGGESEWVERSILDLDSGASADAAGDPVEFEVLTNDGFRPRLQWLGASVGDNADWWPFGEVAGEERPSTLTDSTYYQTAVVDLGEEAETDSSDRGLRAVPPGRHGDPRIRPIIERGRARRGIGKGREIHRIRPRSAGVEGGFLHQPAKRARSGQHGGSSDLRGTGPPEGSRPLSGRCEGPNLGKSGFLRNRPHHGAIDRWRPGFHILPVDRGRRSGACGRDRRGIRSDQLQEGGGNHRRQRIIFGTEPRAAPTPAPI